MHKKRLLTVILAICMVLSCFTPAAAVMSPTVTAADSTATGSVQNTGNDSTEAPSGLQLREHEDAAEDRGVVSGSDAISDISADVSDVDSPASVNEWTIEKVEDDAKLSSISELLSQAANGLDAVDAAAEAYEPADVVTLFVVLEDEPTSAIYSSPTQVPNKVTDSYASKQEAVLSAIRKNVDSKVEVVTQFTYLTNSIVLSTKYENMSAIAQMDGVASVFVSPVFYPAQTTDADEMTVSSGQMTNVDDVWSLNDTGYTGAGMTIAILDTGLDTDHPSFAAAPELTEDSWTVDSLQALLDEYADVLNVTNRFAGDLTADYLYYSAKIPFTFNYALGNNRVTHDNDSIGDHGTHVAGIAAANELEGTGVVGMAPDAQLVIMKVFNSTTGGASLYDFVAALEDCIILGVDVANLSLGSYAGFSSSSYEEIDAIFERIAASGLIVNIAAGNDATSAEGSLYGTGSALTSSIDNSTVASPSTYANVMSIASVDNEYVMADYFTLADGTKVFYQPSVELLYEYTNIGLWEVYQGQELEYVVIDGLGEIADFYDEDGNSIVEGKVAVIPRGTITFGTKIYNAEVAGAAAAFIWDSVSEDIYSFGMTSEYDDGSYPNIPAVLIRLEDGQIMAEAENKTLTVAVDAALRINSTGGQISSFSSWGVSADLRLLPDLSGIGGNVYSCYTDGQYGLMSGTSMATPQVTGVTALVKQYLESRGIYDREVVEALMMSTANVIMDSDSDVETSPRQQGAGVVDALKAVTSEAYLTVDGGRPKAELGDSADGVYSFSFEIHNFGESDKTYALSSSLICEDWYFSGGYYFMAEADCALDGSVSFSSDTVTVPAGETAVVDVTVTVSSKGKAWIEKYFENGNYVEGYIYLTDTAEEGGVDMSLPFMGFYSDWSDAPVFDSGYWYSESFWSSSIDGLDSTMDAEEYWHVLWTSMGSSENDWILGLNPYSGVISNGKGKVLYSSDNNVLTPNGDGIMDKISDYYLSLLRNARYVWLTYTDEDGNILDRQALVYESKTMYTSNYGQTIPSVYSWYYDTNDLYDFTDADGNYLPDGTKLTLTISAVIDYDLDEKVTEDGEPVKVDDQIVIPITIDTVAPEIVSVKEVSNNVGHYLIVTIDEDHPATVALLNPTGTQIYEQVYDDSIMYDEEEDVWTVTLDITGHGDDFMLVVGDYGYQESSYQISRKTSGGNDPTVDTSLLYAYQVYNLPIWYYYGWDYQFGWVTIDTDTGDMSMINSDANEYYAINAAEYVDGYVFAIDAGGNFLYMKPGLWNRNTICNIGYNVIDMAFDDTTDTMYLTISDDDEDRYALASIDIMTGELEILRDYYSKYYVPWAMTVVDGQLYCCKYYYTGFYQIDMDTYALSPVYNADGEQFRPVNSYGYNAQPFYAQSMTYSKEDGLIYWLYCTSDSTSEFITIDPTTWTNTATALGNTEYVGVLTMEETDYTIPEADEITKIALSQTEALVARGQQLTLTARPLPWNAPAGDITWESSDPSVVTVEDGVITGISEGSAIITATCNGVIAECSVRVIELGDSIRAYDNSADGTYGYWQTIDLATMTATNDDYSDVEFMAADYNGHDGYIYGVDSNNFYLWKVDPATAEATVIGYTGVVADMTYDYSTGIMYAINGSDTYLYAVNLYNGALVNVADTYDYLGVLASDMDGTLYGITMYSGELVVLNVSSGEEHEHDWEYAYKAATCVEDGYEGYICGVCGEEDLVVIPATGKHEYAYNTDGDLVCTMCGKVQSTVLPTVPTVPTTPTEPDEPDEPDEPVELPFIDVDENDWFYDEVYYVYVNGLMNGTGSDTFEPNTTVTRAMAITTIYRLAGSPAVTGTNAFTDLTQDWYVDAVQWGVENGVTNGISATEFDPNTAITREQLATMLWRYAKVAGYDVSASASLDGYTDASEVSDYAVEAMQWAVGTGLIKGRTDTTLVPQGNATRAEMAVILMRFSENIAVDDSDSVRTVRSSVVSAPASTAGSTAKRSGWDSLYAALSADYVIDDDIGFDPIDPGFGIEGEDEGLMQVEVSYIGTITPDGLYYGQCMAYDYNNDVLIWCYTDGETFYQIGLGTDENGDICIDYVYDLGCPSGHTLPQYFGIYVVPDEIPELAVVPMTDLKIDPMFLLVDQTASPATSISPVNMNKAYDYYYMLAMAYDEEWNEDYELISVDETTGTVTANKAGVAWVEVYVFEKDADPDESEPVFYTDFQVTVKNSSKSSIVSYFSESDCWIDIDQYDTANPEFNSYAMYNGSYYMIYAAEYVNETGLIYGYGYDINDWSANFCFMTIEPATMKIVSLTDMGDEFPFVYDMAFDYSTGTMYALAGTTNVVSLYYVDINSGKLITACTLDVKCLSVAVDPEGTVYVVSQNDGVIYTVDVEAGTVDMWINTGVSNPYLSSLSYDYTTGYMLWTPYTGMYLIDLNDYTVNYVGETAGQYNALLLLADEEYYPESPDDLTGVMLTTEVAELNVNDTLALEYFVKPFGIDSATVAWSSSNEDAAAVDENGVVTAVGAGTATITITVTNPETETSVSFSCTIIVYGEDDYFLSYNATDKGFSAINRVDTTIVTNLTEDEEAAAVEAMTMMNGVIYAYDTEGNLFTTTVDSNFERSYIGNHGIDISDKSFKDVADWGGGYVNFEYYTARFVVQDMTVYNGKLLALGVEAYDCHTDSSYNGEITYSYEWSTEVAGGVGVYEVNTETGAMTKLCTVTTENGSYNYMSGAKMLEAAGDKLYIYSAYNDHINVLNVEDGSSYTAVSLQSFGYTGEPSTSGMMSMSYDEGTNSLYLMHTSNGSCYRLFKIDNDTMALKMLGYAGNVVYNSETWSYEGADLFRGLVIMSSN